MRFRATVLMVAALALSATFTGSAVAVPNVVDQYTEQFPSPTGPGAPKPGGPNDGQQSGSTAGSGQDTALLDWLTAIGAPVPSSADSAVPMEEGGYSGQGPDGSPGDLGVDQAGNPQDPTAAQPDFQTETGGLGSGMGIVFPVILLLVTVAALASLFARKGAHGQAGQG
jgi:hypothetical protein